MLCWIIRHWRTDSWLFHRKTFSEVRVIPCCLGGVWLSLFLEKYNDYAGHCAVPLSSTPFRKEWLIFPAAGVFLVENPQPSAIFKDSLSWLHLTKSCPLPRTSHTQWLIIAGVTNAQASCHNLGQLWGTMASSEFPREFGLGFYGDRTVDQLPPV